MKSRPRHILPHVGFIYGLFDQFGTFAKNTPECTISANLVRAGEADSFSSETLDTFAIEAVCLELSVAETGE